ncbi:MAG: RiPP maturation radical SAM C-methyltransferase, partial [Vicinamibacteria bacterium]|nr:RiPP maturation radical SAM C-methyltransferase [Vicinamibacteria bacterium]
LAEILAAGPRLVGFTSIFQQHVASLALARRLKQASPATFVVFGGANCEGPMGAETVRQFPFVDAVVSGEADLVFPELVRRVLAGLDVSDLPGVVTPVSAAAVIAAGRFPGAPAVARLDDLPAPDYADFFEQFERSRYAGEWQPSLFFESSRGCWWGERQHCTFCGLNGQSMAYRSKSPERAVSELAALAEQHPGSDVQVVDNILDLRYFETVLPELARRQLKVDLFYETKANLKKEQVRALRAAGITRIQPGIESLSDAVLKLMRKGVSGLHNVQLLKWCAELGVEPHWNVLWGFAGEPPAEYARMAAWVPRLTHLRPPTGFGTVRIDRFSPNFFDAEQLGFADLAPTLAYRLVFDLPPEALANLAYYFTYGYQQPQDVDGYTRALARELRRWQRAAPAATLFTVPLDEALVVWDQRPASRVPLRVLGPIERALLAATDAAALPEPVAATLARAGHDLAPAEVEARLGALVAMGLVLRDGRRHLALPLPLAGRTLSPAASRRFRELARTLGSRIAGGMRVRLDADEPSRRWRGRRSAGRAAASRLRPRFSRVGEHLEIRWGRDD